MAMLCLSSCTTRTATASSTIHRTTSSRLVFGMRRGGDNYYMLDVTSTNKTAAQGLSGYRTTPEFGSVLVVADRCSGSTCHYGHPDQCTDAGSADRWWRLRHVSRRGSAHPEHRLISRVPTYRHAGSGYRRNRVWRAGKNVGVTQGLIVLSNMTRARSRRRVRVHRYERTTVTRTGCTPPILAARSGVSTSPAATRQTGLVTGGVIAQLGAEGPWRHIRGACGYATLLYDTPDVAMFKRQKAGPALSLLINIGTGYRAHPLDNSAGGSLLLAA